MRERKREGDGGEKERERDKEKFISGCDESKSGSHWTELRKSVDREHRRSGRRRRW